MKDQEGKANVTYTDFLLYLGILIGEAEWVWVLIAAAAPAVNKPTDAVWKTRRPLFLSYFMVSVDAQ